MADKRALILSLVIILTIVRAKVFTRCQLTRELLKNNFSRTFISNWVCMIEQESDRNTSALVIKTPKKKYYGIFQIYGYENICMPFGMAELEDKHRKANIVFVLQIGSDYCKEGRKGGKCDISCEALLDEDIKEDSICALKVFEREGFKYWSRWETRCKGQTLPDVEKCPEWLYP